MAKRKQGQVPELVRRDGDQEVLFVRDNGRGIEPRFHQQVFELFERLEATEEGTGIGLAVGKRIVELHGGRVWVESEGEGRGSTFCFTLADPRAGDPGNVSEAGGESSRLGVDLDLDRKEAR